MSDDAGRNGTGSMRTGTRNGAPNGDPMETSSNDGLNAEHFRQVALDAARRVRAELSGSLGLPTEPAAQAANAAAPEPSSGPATDPGAPIAPAPATPSDESITVGPALVIDETDAACHESLIAAATASPQHERGSAAARLASTVQERLDAWVGLVADCDEQAARLENSIRRQEEIEAKTRLVRTSLERQIAEAAVLMDELPTKIDEVVARATIDMHQKSGALVDRRTHELGEAFDARLAEVQETRALIEGIDDRLESALSKATISMHDRANGIVDRRTSEIEELIGEKLARLEGAETRLAALETGVDEVVAKATIRIHDRAGKVVDRRVEELDEMLSARLARIEEVERRLEAAATRADEACERLGREEARVGDAVTRMDAAIARTNGTAAALESSLETANGVKELLGSAIRTLGDDARARRMEATELVERLETALAEANAREEGLASALTAAGATLEATTTRTQDLSNARKSLQKALKRLEPWKPLLETPDGDLPRPLADMSERVEAGISRRVEAFAGTLRALADSIGADVTDVRMNGETPRVEVLANGVHARNGRARTATEPDDAILAGNDVIVRDDSGESSVA